MSFQNAARCFAAIALLAAGCGSDTQSTGLALLADAVVAGRPQRCGEPDAIVFTRTDEPIAHRICSAGAGTDSDTMVLVGFGSGQTVLDITRLWHSKSPERDWVALGQRLERTLGPASPCAVLASDSVVSQYTWRRASTFVSIDRLRPDSILRWVVGLGHATCFDAPVA
jgi:hypothetical protein